MIRIAQLVAGMRVVTPRGLVAKVLGLALNTSDDIFTRVNLRYLDPELGEVQLQANVLRPYQGPVVVFPDEAEELRHKFDDRPLAIRPAGAGE